MYILIVVGSKLFFLNFLISTFFAFCHDLHTSYTLGFYYQMPQICAMLSGLLGTLQLEALVVVMNFNALVFMVPLGLSISLSVLVGNHLGANQPDVHLCNLMIYPFSELLHSFLLTSNMCFSWIKHVRVYC